MILMVNGVLYIAQSSLLYFVIAWSMDDMEIIYEEKMFIMINTNFFLNYHEIVEVVFVLFTIYNFFLQLGTGM